MIILLSPAKTMDTEIVTPTGERTPPSFLDKAAGLVDELATLDKAALKTLLGVSDTLADLNYDRYQEWSTDMSVSRQAMFTYKGDAYVGLDAFTLSIAEIDFAQSHLMILSGLYGVLRPLDAIHPYRLEMGGRFAPKGHKNLLAFWKGPITDHLKRQLDADPSPWILDLASKEYSNAVDFKTLGVPVIAPQFLEKRDGKTKMISSFAKKARGTMARWAIQARVSDSSDLKDFTEAGYAFQPDSSTDDSPVFTR